VGSLKLDQSGAFTGTVGGFTGYAAIDLADIVDANATLGYAANANGTGGVLTLSDGAHTASLALLGQYAAAADFATAADQNGGTVVTLSDPTQNHTLVVPHA
jgi:trimeric autotransporter adhesin